METVDNKLEEYKIMLDFNDENYGVEFKENFELAEYLVNLFKRQGINATIIYDFISQVIEKHKEIYC